MKVKLVIGLVFTSFLVNAQSWTWVVEPKYQEIRETRTVFIVEDEQHKKGIVGHDGKVIIEANYQQIYVDENDAFFVLENYEGEYDTSIHQDRLVDKTGKSITDSIYSFLLPADGGLFVFKKEDKYGFLNEMGAVVIPNEYQQVGYFSEGFIAVQKENKWGFINKAGAIVIPFQYDDAEEFSEGFAAVKQDGKWGFINKKGQLAIPYSYDEVDFFKSGFCVVSENNEKFTIDTKGKLVGTYYFKNNNILFSDGIAQAFKLNENQQELKGYIDAKGKTVIPFQFIYCTDFSEGLAGVEKNGKWGYIDKKGHLKIAMKYTAGGKFSEGLVQVQKQVQKKDKWGYVDKKGTMIIPFNFDFAFNFVHGMAIVQQGDKWGIIDKKGKFLVNPEFEDIWIDKLEDLVIVKKDGKWGIIKIEKAK